MIALSEGLQYQWINVMTRVCGEPAVIAVESFVMSRKAGSDARHRLSQDKVHSLLADLGFRIRLHPRHIIKFEEIPCRPTPT